jgi:hypothetical protein
MTPEDIARLSAKLDEACELAYARSRDSFLDGDLNIDAVAKILHDLRIEQAEWKVKTLQEAVAWVDFERDDFPKTEH